ncbi:MAG: hypothetical protein E3K32_01550 [wastewater metagenome]|nr:hypothetical protein [Candidatus Loosdrechtia aerotolerans]
MLNRFMKPTGIVLAGILCIHMNAFASAEKETTKAEQRVVATVNGETITQEEVDKILGRFANQISQEQVPTVTRQIVDGLVTQKLIMQFIKNKKIEAEQADVEAELNKVREEAQSNPELQGQTLEQILERHGGSIEDLKRDITISLSLEKYLGKDIDDKKIKSYFEKKRSEYDGTEVKASHVLVDTRKMNTEEELAQAKEKIKKAKEEIEAGKDFGEVAKKYSDCPSKEKGGDLGFFVRKGQMVEPFAAAAFSMKKGQISDPVETDFGYHIIKVTDIRKGQDINFNDIKRDVKIDMMSESLNTLLKELKQKAEIDIRV